MASNYRRQLEEYLAGLDVKANVVFDVGGASNPVQGRVKSWDVKTCIFIDNLLEPSVLKGDGQTRTQVFDLNTDHVTSLGHARADHIFCLEVFEYIWNPVQALKSISDWLRPGGWATITFPTLYPPHNPVEHDALRYELGGIKKLMKKSHLDILKTIPRKMALDSTPAYMAYVGTEGYKVKGGIEAGTLHDIGYIIEARKL